MGHTVINLSDQRPGGKNILRNGKIIPTFFVFCAFAKNGIKWRIQSTSLSLKFGFLSALELVGEISANLNRPGMKERESPQLGTISYYTFPLNSLGWNAITDKVNFRCFWGFIEKRHPRFF